MIGCIFILLILISFIYASLNASSKASRLEENNYEEIK